MKRWLGVAVMLFTLPATAGDFQAFGRESRLAIEQAHAGKPFILAFWSVDCAYCPDEVRQLTALVRKRPDIGLVLVSTDSLEMQSQAAEKLAGFKIPPNTERWIFAGEDPDRLYFAVDRKWHGELPRSYFYDGAGRVQGVSGKVDPVWLDNWARGSSGK